MSMGEAGDTKGDVGDAAGTPGGIPPEKVEERPSVGSVSPSDYPDARDGSKRPDGAGDPRPNER